MLRLRPRLARHFAAITFSLASFLAHAAPLLSGSFDVNVVGGFGPFSVGQDIPILVTVTNTSSTQAIGVCEGVCLGNEFTYSLGGLASVPPGFQFFFGDEPAENVFDGQVPTSLAPGEAFTFVFGVFQPDSGTGTGLYPFLAQLQIFDASPERNLLSAPTFSGFLPVPEPSTVLLLLAAIAVGACRRRVMLQRVN
jgi:hypothetical protein